MTSLAAFLLSSSATRLMTHSKLITLALLGCLGCSGDTPATASENLAPCTGTVAAIVSSGTTPTFSWTPECRMRIVLIEDDAHDVWAVEAGIDGIAPPVRYGVLPTGAKQLSPLEPLVRGSQYDLILYGGRPGSEVLAALVHFTP